MDRNKLGRLLRRAAVTCLVLVVVVAVSAAVARLEAHVDRRLVEHFGRPTLTFMELPDQRAELVRDDLNASLSDLLTRDWTDDRLCRDMAARLESNGWIARVNFVRRTGDARFEVSARYRLPVAMVQLGDEFRLVDREGVRLPGTYLYDPAWKLIQGVGEPAPKAGTRWGGADLETGLTIIAALVNEPFSDQITAVLVDNIDGRRNPRRSHIDLATDRAGGRIRWGSAPGSELAENSVSQKLSILRENYRRTGRVDAGHPVIDISTYPDRFTIPG